MVHPLNRKALRGDLIHPPNQHKDSPMFIHFTIELSKFDGKLSFFEQMMSSEWDFDLICLSETWLRSDKVPDNALDLTNFTQYRRDRPSRTHGGLLVYAKSNLCTHRRVDLESSDIELSIPAPKHVIFFCYCPPDQSPDIFSTLHPVY